MRPGGRLRQIGPMAEARANVMREKFLAGLGGALLLAALLAVYANHFHNSFHFDDAHTEGGGEPLGSVPLTDEELRATDCVVIVTNHTAVDYQRVCQLSSLIVDTRNALNRDVRRDSSARIIRL